MAKRKKKRLMNLDAFEVSLVPKGAIGRKFLQTKESREEEVEEILKEVLEMDLKNEDKIEEVLKQKKLSDEKIKTVKGALKLLQSVNDVPGDVMKELRKLAGLEKEQSKKEGDGEDPKKEASKGSDDNKDGGAAVAGTEDKTQDAKPKADPKEQVSKEQQQIMKELREQNENLQKEIQKERDIRVLKELEGVAEREYSHLGKSKEEIAKMLKKAKDTMDEDGYKEFTEVLKSASKQLEKSSIFKELGSERGDENGYTAQVEAKKAEIRKEDPKLSDAQVESRLLDRNPELYNKYLEENPRQGGY